MGSKDNEEKKEAHLAGQIVSFVCFSMCSFFFFFAMRTEQDPKNL
jgi:hypothetical protein